MATKSQKRFSLVPITAPTAGEQGALLAVSVGSTKTKTPAQKASKGEVKTSRRQGVKTSNQDRRIAFTWRLKLEEADKLEDLLLELRRQLGRPRLDRATLLQTLVDLAVENKTVRTQVVKRLDV